MTPHTPLIEALKECANDLCERLNAEYQHTLAYSSQLRRYNRDMSVVENARAAITEIEKLFGLKPDVQDRDETDAQMLARLADDAGAWAAEFRKVATKLGYSDMDEGWLIGWFANAIVTGQDIIRSRIATETTEPDADKIGAAAKVLRALPCRCSNDTELDELRSREAIRALIDAGFIAAQSPSSIRAEALKEAADAIQKRADNLRGDRKRINQIDLHVIGVLESCASAIRSLGDRG